MKYIRIIFLLNFFIAFNLNAQINYVVNTASDPVNPFNPPAGTLRWAIEQANLSPGPDIISFNISTTVPVTISLNSNLPIITKKITIDGNTQPTPTTAFKKITIDGVLPASAEANYIFLFKLSAANGSSVLNMGLKNGVSSLVAYESSNHIFNNNMIFRKSVVYPTGYWWIGSLIYLHKSNSNTIKGNLIGADNSLVSSDNFSHRGIVLTGPTIATIDGSNSNIIGGPLSSDQNTFYNGVSNQYSSFNPVTYAVLPQPLINVSVGTNNKVTGNKFINQLGGVLGYLNGCVFNGSTGQGCKPRPTVTVTNSAPNIIIQGNSQPNDIIEFYKSNTANDVLQFLGTTNANASGQFNITLTSLNGSDKFYTSATDLTNTTSEFVLKTVPPNPPCCPFSFVSGSSDFLTFNPQVITNTFDATICKGTLFNLTANGCTTGGLNYSWNFADSSPLGSGSNVSHTYNNAGVYGAVVSVSGPFCNTTLNNINITSIDCACNSINITAVNNPASCFNPNTPSNFSAVGCGHPNAVYTWNWGDATSSTGQSPSHIYSFTGTYTITLTVTSPNITTPLTDTYIVNVTSASCINYCCPSNPSSLSLLNPKTDYCVGEPITFNFSGSLCNSDFVQIDMGECQIFPFASGNPLPSTIIQTYNNPGNYIVNIFSLNNNCQYASLAVNVIDCNTAGDVPKCQPTFKPSPGDYILSFWVKEDLLSLANISTYASGIGVTLNSSSGQTFINAFANASSNSMNKIIDGWQKVELRITIPGGTNSIDLSLKNNVNVSVYFDDIRIQPFNSSFKSYVYDPVTLRLAAELDERNYATFYEYDEEGQLIRVKKETERGIKTIKESRTSVSK